MCERRPPESRRRLYRCLWGLEYPWTLNKPIVAFSVLFDVPVYCYLYLANFSAFTHATTITTTHASHADSAILQQHASK